MTPARAIDTPVEADRLIESLDYALIGPTDGRWRVRAATPPYTSICHIGRDFGDGRLSGCTAFLVGPRVAITAGHCLYSLRRRRAPRRIVVSPGRDGAQTPYGAVWAARWYAHPRFIDRTDPRYDYGVIVLPQPLSEPAPALKLTPISSAALHRARSTRLAHIAGYPSDKPRGQMWAHAERLDRFGRRLVLYSVDTCPGHSGAPVWLAERDGSGAVIAVHTRGPRPSARGPWGCRPGAPMAPPGHFNAGVRVTDDLCRAVDDAIVGRGPLRLMGSDPDR